MGFYGNITNTSRSTFQFDKIYPNRKRMDELCGSDGIYVGRYVLIEYDSEASNETKDLSWFLVTVNNKNIVYASINSEGTSEENYYFYIKGNQNSLDSVITISMFNQLSSNTLYFQPKHHLTIENSDRYIYVTINPTDNTYVEKTLNVFLNHYNITNIAQDSDIPKAYIANNKAYISPSSQVDIEDDEIWAYIEPGNKYSYNEEEELWIFNKSEDDNNTFYPDESNTRYKCYKLTQVAISPGNTRDNYAQNYGIDKQTYQTSRGYDSTVWQKVYSNNQEKYVMIAELNTIIPSFGVSADAPSLAPLSPHFGADSTNVYYELHWQPSWGFRVKAADTTIKMPEIQQNGRLVNQEALQMQNPKIPARDVSIDNVQYPSDEETVWQHTFEDHSVLSDQKRRTLYFNGHPRQNGDESIGIWEDNTSNTVSSAIYFNKKGFNPKEVFYSSDLLNEDSKHYDASLVNWTDVDSIAITPSGQSGILYNTHDGSIDLKPAVDTQELSIMLPSIGNTMAQVWDLVYGGRNTAEYIKATNKRNTNIEWEDAKGQLARSGLRLTGIFGDEYNREQVETIAGSINTAHDLLGMIISSQVEEDVENVNNLDENRIYFVTKTDDSTKGVYFRKHKTYEYTPIENDSDFLYERQNTAELNQTDIDSGLYYQQNGNVYEVAETYNPNNTYYLKYLKESYEEVNNITSFPPEGQIWYYRDYLGANSRILKDLPSNSDPKKFSDYIYDTEYHEGRDYYTITAQKITFSTDETYEPGKYWRRYENTGEFALDKNEKDDNQTYYIFENAEQKFKNLKQAGDTPYSGIYVPGVYYYRKRDKIDENKYTFIADVSEDMSCNGDKANPEEFPYIDRIEYNNDVKYYRPQYSEYIDPTGTRKLYRIQYEYVRATVSEDTFIQGRYYIKNGNNYEEAVKFDTAHPNTIYYIRKTSFVEVTESDQVTIDTSDFVYQSNLCFYKADTYFKLEFSGTGKIERVIPLSRNELMSNFNAVNANGIYVYPDANSSTNPPFMTLSNALNNPEFAQRQTAFYQKNTYHYRKKDGSLSYILDTSDLPDIATKDYYDITPTEVNDTYNFYIPNKYYIETTENEEGYEISTDIEMPTGTNGDSVSFYKKKDYYVLSDNNNILSKGMKWNPYAVVDSSITLATREEAWEMINIPGYSTGMGTLNGMILKMYQIIEPNDNLTRDPNTVAGALNQINDIIAHFSTIKPGQVAMIDNYGRIQSSLIETNQVINNKSYKWISININGNPKNPSITIHHEVPDNTNVTSYGGQLSGQNSPLHYGEMFKIPTFSIDNMGHVASASTQDLTLPSISLTLASGSSGNVLTGISLTSSSGAFTYAKEYVGNLALTGYDSSSQLMSFDITANDSINTAFLKVSEKLIYEANRLDQSISSEAALREQDIINRINNLNPNNIPTSDEENAVALELDEGNTITSLTLKPIGEEDEENRGGVIEYQVKPIKIVSSQVSDLDTTITNKINNLDYSASGLGVGKTITSLVETDGIISVAAGDILISSNQVSDLNDTIISHINQLNPTSVPIEENGTALSLGKGNTITALTLNKTENDSNKGRIEYKVEPISIALNQINDLNTLSISLDQISNLNTLNLQNSIPVEEINNTSVPQVHLLTSLSQANGQISYTSVELDYNSHIVPLLPTGNAAFLTVGAASTTYLSKADAIDTYLSIEDATNDYQPKGDYQEAGDYLTVEAAANTYLTEDTEFIWQEADPEQEIEEETKTIDKLIEEIKYLKAWVNYLKDPDHDPNNPPEIDDPDDSPDSGDQGTNPDPNPNDPGEGGNEQNP